MYILARIIRVFSLHLKVEFQVSGIEFQNPWRTYLVSSFDHVIHSRESQVLGNLSQQLLSLDLRRKDKHEMTVHDLGRDTQFSLTSGHVYRLRLICAPCKMFV